MWLVKETGVGKAGPTIELHEEQQKKHGILTELLRSVDTCLARSLVSRKRC
jgi:hypothetical protein